MVPKSESHGLEGVAHVGGQEGEHLVGHVYPFVGHAVDTSNKDGPHRVSVHSAVFGHHWGTRQLPL
jgi:hypothetical protein